MKKHVGKWFIYYKFFNVLWLGLILIGSIYALLMLLNIDIIAGWSIYLIVGVLIGGLFLNTLIGMLVQKNYKDNTFYEITNRHIRVGQAMCYAYFKEEKTAPVHNVLFKLDEEKIVYPGHGDDTTIGRERHFNLIGN